MRTNIDTRTQFETTVNNFRELLRSALRSGDEAPVREAIGKARIEMTAAMARQAPPIPGRVFYTAVTNGSKRAVAALTPRAKQVYDYITKHRQPTAASLQTALKVNRNVIAGALHLLRQSKLVKSEPAPATDMPRQHTGDTTRRQRVQLAHDAPRRRATDRRK